MYPQQTNPPGDYRNMGAGRGLQRGDKQMQGSAAEAGMRRGAQSRAAEAGRWWVHMNSRWTEFCARREGGEQV